MNALVFGRCPQAAQQLSTFCKKVVMVLDGSFARARHIPEESLYENYFSKIKIANPAGILPKAGEIARLIDKYDAEIVYTNDKWSMVAAKLASLLVRRKVVLLSTSHNSYAWLNDKNVSRMTFLIKHTTDCYVALASFVKELLLKNGLPEDKMVVVPNTVGYSSWECKTEYSASKAVKGIYVAYVYPGKRQDLIPDALNLLKNRYNIIFDCFGDTDEYVDYVDSIKDKVKSYGLEQTFSICGRIENSELRHIMKDYDFYVSASHMEMSPLNILEAKASGLPVIAANVGGIPDMIEHNVNGLLFDADDAEDMARQIAALAESKELRERLGRAGRYQVSTVYTKKEAGERLQQVVERILR